MADIIRLRGSAHEEVQRLLPWLVNGTLASDETERAERHLGECPECRADLLAEQKLAQEVARLPVNVDAGWEGMARRLDTEPTFHGLPKASLWRSRVPLGWAVASPLAAVAAMALIVINVSPRQPVDQQYRALGAAGIAQSANLVVLFAPDAREHDMRAALAGAGARMVDGPTETGAYLLRVDGAKRELALKQLRDNGVVMLAEPIDGAAR